MSTHNDKTVRQAFQSLNDYHLQQVLALALIRAAWVGLALVLCLVYVDVVAALSGRQRLALDVVWLAAVPATAILTFRWYRRAISRNRMLARLIERDHEELNNELVNAIDFEEILKQRKKHHFSEDLMGREIDLALDKITGLGDLGCLKPPNKRTEGLGLLGVMGVTALAVLFFFGGFTAVLPRYLDPFGDHPPYSPTRLTVEPGGAEIDYGDNLMVQVAAAGGMPKEVHLVMENTEGEELNRAAMFESEEGRYYQTIENVREEMVYYAGIERGRSKRYLLRLSKVPKIESMEVGYRYPEYTGLGEESRILVDPLIKGYRRTEVALRISSNRPLQGGEVTIGSETVACEKEGEDAVTARFTLKAAGDFSVTVMDVEGNRSTEKVEGKIEIIPDEKPKVAIVSPGMDAFAIPTARIPVVVEAEDDLGVRQVSLFRNLNDSDDARKGLFEDTRALRQVQAMEIFDLGDLGLRPGDVIHYYATAADALPGKPQTVATKPYRLRIISAEEYARMMQQQMDAEELRKKYEAIVSQLNELIQAQQELERQTAALQQELDPNQSPTAAQQEKLQELAQRQDQLAQQTEAFAEQLERQAGEPPVFDIEKDFKERLKGFSNNVRNARSHMERSTEQLAAARSGKAGQSQAGQAREEQQRALEELGQTMGPSTEQMQQALQEIEKMYHLMRDVNRFKELYLQQKSLVRQTRYFQETVEADLDGQIRLKELAEQENDIQAGLNELKQVLRRHGLEIEAAYPQVAEDAKTIADEIDSRQIEQYMQQASAFLDRGSGREGHPRAQTALEAMEAMISFCQGASGEGVGQCEMRLKISMNLNPGDTFNQLAEGMSFGSGMNEGPFGTMGRGSAGAAGGQANFAVYGGETFDKNMVQDSKLVSAVVTDEKGDPMAEAPDPLAGNIEELASEKGREMEFATDGPERMMAEYNQLIEAYFERLAEDR